jgi:hypothetical protein
MDRCADRSFAVAIMDCSECFLGFSRTLNLLRGLSGDLRNKWRKPHRQEKGGSFYTMFPPHIYRFNSFACSVIQANFACHREEQEQPTYDGYQTCYETLHIGVEVESGSKYAGSDDCQQSEDNDGDNACHNPVCHCKMLQQLNLRECSRANASLALLLEPRPDPNSPEGRTHWQD